MLNLSRSKVEFYYEVGLPNEIPIKTTTTPTKENTVYVCINKSSKIKFVTEKTFTIVAKNHNNFLTLTKLLQGMEKNHDVKL